MGRKCLKAGTVAFLTRSTLKHLWKKPGIDRHLGTNAGPKLQQMYQNLLTKN
jgi:hypothetical protein